jgi:cardiolipin synthase
MRGIEYTPVHQASRRHDCKKLGMMINYRKLSLGGELVNVPNFLTAVRFVLIPVFSYYLCSRNYIVAVIVFLSSGLTDILDGYIARMYNMVTSWGKIADPLADKLMQAAALAILSMVIKIIPVEILIVIFIKEILLGIGAFVLYKEDNYVSSANWYGKITTVIFYLAIVMLIFDEPFGRITLLRIPINRFLFILAVLASLFAFFMYVRSYCKIRQNKVSKV